MEPTVTNDRGRRPSFHVYEHFMTLERTDPPNSGDMHGVYCERNEGVLRNLTITGGDSRGYGGIYLGWGSNRVLVEPNVLKNAQVGIRLYDNDPNIIRNSVVADSAFRGLWVMRRCPSRRPRSRSMRTL